MKLHNNTITIASLLAIIIGTTTIQPKCFVQAAKKHDASNKKVKGGERGLRSNNSDSSFLQKQKQQRELKGSEPACPKNTEPTVYDCSETILIDDDYDLTSDVYCHGSTNTLFKVQGGANNDNPTIDCHDHCIFGGNNAFEVYGSATFKNCCLIDQEANSILVVASSIPGESLTVKDTTFHGTYDGCLHIEADTRGVVAPYNLNVDTVTIKHANNGISSQTGGIWNIDNLTWKGAKEGSGKAIFLQSSSNTVSTLNMKDSTISGADWAIYTKLNSESEIYLEDVHVSNVWKAMDVEDGLNLLSIKDSTFENGEYGLEFGTLSSDAVNEMKLDKVQICNFSYQDMAGLGSIDSVDVKDVTCDNAYDDDVNRQLDVTDQFCEDSCMIDQLVYCKA